MLANQRYLSLDVFRGATVALMILVNNPGTWSHIFDPLEHASWHGLTPTDLVFPFFLFAVGNAMAFVMPRLREEGDTAFWKKVVKRTVLIFLIGTFLNWFPFFHWQNGELVFRGWEWTNQQGQLVGVRVSGTLQRIALCYFFASVIVYYAKARGAAIVGAAILLGYWILCLIMNPEDPYSFEGWFGKAIDLNFFGEAHVYRGDGVPFENEGLISTLPAIVTVIIGFVVGDYILTTRGGTGLKSEGSFIPSLYRTLTILFVAAALLLLTGYIWSLFFPLNKKIQSSSFVIVTAGLAIAILSSLIYWIEVKNKKGFWTGFFNVFGKNPLFIYALSELIPRLSRLIRIPVSAVDGEQTIYTSPLGWFYQNICAQLPGPPEIGSLFYAICMVFFYWAIGYWMSRKQIFIRV
jgi:predicted acyltransferase